MAERGVLGISLPNRLAVFGFPANELVNLAVRAEASGAFGSVWVGDSLLAKPRLESLTLLGAIAARTTTVRLGTMCLASFPLRDPILLAIQTASLDILSNGRLVLGVCSGPGHRGGPAAQEELARFGVASADRGAVLETNVLRLRRLWGQADPAGGSADAPVAPRPLQDRLPIFIAATPPPADDVLTRKLLDRVARLADGWIADAVSGATFVRLWRQLLEAAEAAGRAGRIREAVVHVPVVVAPSRRAAEEIACSFLAQHLGVRPAAAQLPAAGAYGPPSLVADHLDGLLAAGVSTPVLRMLSPDPGAQLDRLVGDVVPRVGSARSRER
jgi:alkanesulfonate monooxygenase SsuD/methylene tetrahydromethanopterin reductase-like flavin-dependent oxidoreductase (luciferase family)